jgi:hypothetical protein
MSPQRRPRFPCTSADLRKLVWSTPSLADAAFERIEQMVEAGRHLIRVSPIKSRSGGLNPVSPDRGLLGWVTKVTQRDVPRFKLDYTKVVFTFARSMISTCYDDKI